MVRPKSVSRNNKSTKKKKYYFTTKQVMSLKLAKNCYINMTD